MIGPHITASMLIACEEGEISPHVLFRHVLRHLQEQCEVCLDEVASFRARRLPTSSIGLLNALIEEAVPLPAEESKATKDLTTLLPLSISERKLKVERALSRFRSPLLARELIQEAIGELGSDLKEAEDLVKLAFAVLSYAPASNFSREVKAHGLAVEAMIAKIRDDFRKAEELLKEARRLLPPHGVVDLVLSAELDEMEGSFLKDCREFSRAEELLLRAISRYELLEDGKRHARTLLVLGGVHFYTKQVDAAIAVAGRVLDVAPEESLYRVIAAHNMALYLTESGRSAEAARRFKENEPNYQKVQGVWQLHDVHFHWLAGKISYGLGRFEQAEAHLLKARDGFVERDTCAYDAILVCLDLALVYDAMGRDQEMMSLSRLISGELARKSLHEESVVAVSLFLKAAARQALSEELVKQVSRFLEFSRTDPTLKCEITLD